MTGRHPVQMKDIPEIARLSTPEKILLVEDSWDSIARGESDVAIPQATGTNWRKNASPCLDSRESVVHQGASGKDRQQKVTFALRFLPAVEEDVLTGYLV